MSIYSAVDSSRADVVVHIHKTPTILSASDILTHYVPGNFIKIYKNE